MTLFDRLNAQRPWMEEERLVLDQVMRTAEDVIAPAAVGYDKSGDYPETSMATLNKLGMNAIFVPEAYGGALMSYRLYLECVSIISAACASTARRRRSCRSTWLQRAAVAAAVSGRAVCCGE